MEGRCPPFRHASRPPELLRPQALELLRCRSARRRDTACARAAVRASGQRCGPSSPRSSSILRSTSGARIVKPAVVYTAGLLRRIGRPIDTTSWSWIGSMSGQMLFYPPNVAGWDDTRWLDTATWRGRWWTAQNVLSPYALDPGKASPAVRRRRARRGRARILAQPCAQRADAQRRSSASRSRRWATRQARRGSASNTRSWRRTRCAS